MPVHGPTALQAKLKLEGRSVLTCGSLGRCRSVGAVMLTSPLKIFFSFWVYHNS